MLPGSKDDLDFEIEYRVNKLYTIGYIKYSNSRIFAVLLEDSHENNLEYMLECLDTFQRSFKYEE